ncbi:MAG: gliding motility-associated C-terminal domain-containing protein [Crocinitomicaceae bacterium]|nr:gliding motility-associated C-terminal domain-containing protein [Crocinitomicaceae bacterium]
MEKSRLITIRKQLVLLLGSIFLSLGNSFGQDTIAFPPGSSTSYVVPPCGGAGIELTMGGAPGGGPCGGNGALLTGTIPVGPGDVIDIIVGQSGGCPNPVPPGAGQGWASSNGNVNYNSCSGGSLTQISINGVVYAIVGAGGGSGGGSVNCASSNYGGDGGCITGQAGGNTFGQGGQPGTQTGPGAGGTPWAGTPPGGSPGVGTSGGNGGYWQTASGGGGGAGYFGGGGGGNDGCCTGANGGGGGGGGSSLIPAGIGCIDGGNSGPADVTFVVPNCETTICSGDTAMIDFSTQFPAGATNYTVSPAIGVYQPIPGDPNIGLHPTDSIIYDVTATVAGSPVTIQWPVHVVQMIQPDAGLNDSLCFSPTNAYNLNGTPWNNGNITWEMANANTFSGGAGTTTFTPSNNIISPAAYVNLAGEYTFVIHESDTAGVCPDGTDTVMIYYSEEAHTSTFVDPLCNGASDGSITITSDNTASSGNLGATQYSIDNGTTFQANGNFTGLTAGTYNIITEDYIGCQSTSQVTLTDPPPIVMSLVSSDTTICINGSATLAASASGAPAGGTYTYYWSASPDNTASTTITPSPPGTNFSSTVFAQSDLGCYSDTLTLNIDHHPPISLSITPTVSICPGDDATHTVTASGGYLNGNPDYSYSWSANGIAMANTSNTINVNPNITTTYCVTVDDGCETTPEAICSDVIMNDVPVPMFSSDLTWGCNPTEIKFWNTTNNVVTDSVTFLINGNYYLNPDTVVIDFTDVGTYDVWMEVYSDQGCHDAITAQEYITIYDVPDPMFYANPNPTTMFNTEVNMNNVTPGLNNTYEWLIPGGNPTTSSVENPTVFYPEGIMGEYPVTLIATNEWGCEDSVTSVVEIVSEVILYAPNIFTPDGDEANETWRVYIDGIDIYNFHLTLFNRWGEIVWESYNQTAEWRGNYAGGGVVQDGTYVWVIECREMNTDKKYEFRGHVTVLK